MTERSRIASVQILQECIERKKELSLVQNNNSLYQKLSRPDQKFSSLIVNQCLRHKGQIDSILNEYLSNPKRIPLEVFYVLRVAAGEWFFTDSPSYAVVNNAVNATKYLKKFKLSGLVNAIIRKISSLEKDHINSIDPTINFPSWLKEFWIKDYGRKTASIMMENALNEYPLYINVKNTDKNWEEILEAKYVTPNLLRCFAKNSITTLEGFADGEWWVQGFESSLPALLIGDIKNKRVLDCCAAPGGKTAQLINAGAEVVAIDKNVSRIKTLEENLERLKFKATIKEVDAITYKDPELFDAILIDAPCSATGTIRKNPDALYLKKPSQIKELAKTQKNILENISKLLKVNGTLIYSTCSLQKEEGEKQIESFLKENKNYKLDAIKSEEIFGFYSLINKDGMVRIIPEELNESIETDGFFIARMKRIKE